jgi:hypothetical protein
MSVYGMPAASGVYQGMKVATGRVVGGKIVLEARRCMRAPS